MTDQESPQGPPRGAIAVGLALTVAICAFAYYYDCVVSSGHFNRLIPHLMPPIVFGPLILFCGLALPLLRKFRKPQAPSAATLAVVAALALAACSVPFFGMVHCWPTALVMPHHYQRVDMGLKSEKIVAAIPARMLVDVGEEDGDFLNGYMMGLSDGKRPIALREVPWRAWLRPMLFWIPLVLAFTFTCVGLMAVLNRQWAHHERLPYPLVQFAHTLLPDNRHSVSAIFREKGFLVGAALVFVIHMVNYAAEWWPQTLIPIRLRLDFSALQDSLKLLIDGGGGLLFQPRIIFSVIGLAFLFSSEVSLSIAIAPILASFVLGLFAVYGMPVMRGSFSLYGNANMFMFLGGYTGLVAVLLYTGRRFYGNVLKRSLGFRGGDACEASMVWSMRLFLGGGALFVGLLVGIGLDWLLALLYLVIGLIVLVACCRAFAEAGLFYIGTYVFPCAMLWGFFGNEGLGPEAFATMGMVSTVVMVGPGWAPMLFALQGLRLTDMTNVATGRSLSWILVALTLGLAVALPVTIYIQHNYGVASAASGWALTPSRMVMDETLKMTRHLKAQGALEDASAVSGLARLAHMRPAWPMVATFAVTATLAAGCFILRLRLPWWPLHPILFFALSAGQTQMFYFSFLLGWIVKTWTTRYGGLRAVNRIKPIMIGFIAGEIVAGLVPLVVGTLYRLIAQQPAPLYSPVLQ